MIGQDEIDELAAQYVLGALTSGERRMIQARLGHEPVLAEAVRNWERRLGPLSLKEPGRPPPPHALEAILAAVAQKLASRQRELVSPTMPLHRRKPGAVATVLAASMAVVVIALGAVMIDQQRLFSGTITALLTMDTANPSADEAAKSQSAAFVVAFDRRSSQLTVRQTRGEPARADRAHVLWLVGEGDIEAELIGRLDRTGQTTLYVREAAARQMERGWLQMTQEAEMPGGKPRGPVIAKGRLAIER